MLIYILFYIEMGRLYTYISEDRTILYISSFLSDYNTNPFTRKKNMVRYYGPELDPSIDTKYIISLFFDPEFNEPLELGDIPDFVNCIHFGYKFNQEIEPGVVPNSVKYMTFGSDFNEKIKFGTIPKSVIEIEIRRLYGRNYDQPKENIVFYPTIETVKIGDNIYKNGTDKFHDRFTIYHLCKNAAC